MSAISTFSYTLVAAMLTPHQYADTCQASPSAAFAAGFWAQKWPARRANPDGLILKIQKCYFTEQFLEDRIQSVIQVQDPLLMVLAFQNLVHVLSWAIACPFVWRKMATLDPST